MRKGKKLFFMNSKEINGLLVCINKDRLVRQIN
jgi:hypothetical protein